MTTSARTQVLVHYISAALTCAAALLAPDASVFWFAGWVCATLTSLGILSGGQRLLPLFFFVGGGAAMAGGLAGALLGNAVHTTLFGWARLRRVFASPRMSREDAYEFSRELQQAKATGGTWPEPVSFTNDETRLAVESSAERLVRLVADIPELAERAVDTTAREGLRAVPDSLADCLSRFIGSELDWRTPTVRGLGRASTFLPRLGSQGPAQLFMLGTEGRQQLARLMLSTVIDGYVALRLVEELDSTEVGQGAPIGAETLFEKWLPSIYAVSASNLGPAFRIAERHAEPSLADLNDWLRRQGIQSVKIRLLTNHYVIAGWMLRASEIRSA